MLANMAVSLVMHEQIQTTVPKAKELRPYLEVLVTKAKRSDLATRRGLISKIKDHAAVEKLIAVLAPRYKERPGGYLRIVKSGWRHGDMAPMAYIEFVDRDVSAKGAITPKQSVNNYIEDSLPEDVAKAAPQQSSEKARKSTVEKKPATEKKPAATKAVTQKKQNRTQGK